MDTGEKHLVIVNYAYQDELESPDMLLKSYFTLSEWASICSKKGIRVSVFQRFKTTKTIFIDNIQYFFIHDLLPPKPAFYHCTFSFHKKILAHIKTIRTSANDQICLHINGFIFPACIFHLTYNLDASINSIIQHHAEYPNKRVGSLLYSVAFKRVKSFFFTTLFHAKPWVNAKAITESKVIELMECSSNLKSKNKKDAKRKLNIKGEPLLLWTGNLTENKDPLTILDAFESFLYKHSNAQLMMIFQDKTLLKQVEEKIKNSEKLKNAVTIIGKVPYQTIADYYNAADIFVQGSAREGSGVAVLDALACAVIPVITEIPSFKALTEDGSVGVLWERGQASELTKALCLTMEKNLAEQQQQCQKLFEKRWSFNALATKAIADYFD
ncbi:glycosyltransferase family 4 protein [Aliikangiella sp. IMCC44359]|uniref:glycosyltransferase family 4 protein n=1 Tax=Aliikangiella sp. IMCC44359 TaxID=3459125 RepID=UPI00403ABD90